MKISYNNVFGYYIEVRNTHKDKVPESWIRKQTLANAERYITEELKEYEEKILGAEEKMLLIEQRIYAELIGFITHSLGALQRDAAVVARIDCCNLSPVSLGSATTSVRRSTTARASKSARDGIR